MEQLKEDLSRLLRGLVARDFIAAALVVAVVSVILYLGHRIESQKEFYRSVASVNYDQQRDLTRILYARMVVLKMVANKLGISDSDIIAEVGPEAFATPALPAPPPLRAP